MDVQVIVIAFLISFFVTVCITPLVKKVAVKIGALDEPEERKIHQGIRPRLGGLAIFIGVAVSLMYLQPNHEHFFEIALGGLIIIITGILDDLFQLKPIYKLIGQVSAALLVISSGLIIEKITLPFFGLIYLENFSFIITILWVIGVTNAINLIDGLDGLAAGVSTIALASILVMGILDYRVTVVYLCIVLIGSNLGFLIYNFYPAKIFMGDTGALFLGYCISIISMLGLFKNVALFSFIIPIIILAIPIFDTLFAIIRRATSGQKIMAPDKKHLHYQLINAGFSHRTSVLIIYSFSTLFGILAILFTNSTLLTSFIIITVIVFFLHIIAEIVGLVGNGQQPVLNLIRRILGIKKATKNQEQDNKV
ncbi:glycosyltransferase family 4 protein [Salinibacillus xinjiangensis]|uniref:Undecaprenyl-phosphate alpha-N-acetylglucosaminyl 1-phosphate transferase n=1 Tax=Salinibacillus xinjiangensis TaxID=1229268 RepID=A0A6G1X242_9BACI|nr:MraY family glycosyltransferase [Salinibacillus xinjiangensis]MRG85053.1 undecaprenyl-phosphate alpha-N-acetylglucosaminyl 1-phosphate transferase [Salinibacillus xinjiangensis]